MKFILSRTEDYKTHSKKWIVGYGLLFWLISRIAAAAILIGCVAVYKGCDLDPEALTKFGGSPETAKNMGSALYTFLTLLLAAPLFEECIFRLWLSFRKWEVAAAVAAIPAYLLWQHIPKLTPLSGCIYVVIIAAAFFAIQRFTQASFWERQRQDHFSVYVWASAIAFGLIHLVAFSAYSLTLLPYMLCVILVPFFAGCAITYYRINLGFWWGVGLHIFNNLPAIFILASL